MVNIFHIRDDRVTKSWGFAEDQYAEDEFFTKEETGWTTKRRCDACMSC